ncbi:MAG: sulfatase-like hydrolase/transferase [Rhodobacteraceae bacterium]|jgi:phosphoglycerol transferase|nr:sulfatase-like hydrolase/transferase [Paracoccaceae bacterium]
MPSAARSLSVAASAIGPVLVFLILALPALLAAGEVGLWPGLRWWASVALMTAFVLMAGSGRATRVAMPILVVLFVLANTALALSFVMQGKPFNDAFFAHLDLSTLAMAWKTDALRMSAMVAYVLAAPVAVHLLAARATVVADWAGRVHLVPKLGALGLSLLLSYPLAAYADYRIARAESSDRLMAEIERLRAESPAAAPVAAAGAPRNLVLIYLESVEETFFDEELFPGLMPNLARLRDEGVSFGDMRQYPGTGWTIAAMVASQCGVPLLSEMWGNDILTTVGNPFARVDCLGEHLQEAGFATAFVGGATLDFAGKGNFLRDNGFDVQLGLDELPNTGAHMWGLYDVDTFAHATELFDGLAGGEAPFLLSVLTLDTHFPDGMPSPGCRPYAPDALLMLDAVHCADQLVAAFVAHVRASPVGEDTVIAIMSDHLFMEGEVEDMLDKGVRRPFFFLLDPDRGAQRVAGPFTHFDVAPTLLEAVGLPGARFAFGQSLLSHDQGLAVERNLTEEDFAPFTIEALTEVEVARTH